MASPVTEPRLRKHCDALNLDEEVGSPSAATPTSVMTLTGSMPSGRCPSDAFTER